MTPIDVAWLIARSAAPSIWEALVAGKAPEEIKLSDVMGEAAANKLRRRAALERLKRGLPPPMPPSSGPSASSSRQAPPVGVTSR